jgi:hypothetical protein
MMTSSNFRKLKRTKNQCRLWKISSYKLLIRVKEKFSNINRLTNSRGSAGKTLNQDFKRRYKKKAPRAFRIARRLKWNSTNARRDTSKSWLRNGRKSKHFKRCLKINRPVSIILHPRLPRPSSAVRVRRRTACQCLSWTFPRSCPTSPWSSSRPSWSSIRWCRKICPRWARPCPPRALFMRSRWQTTPVCNLRRGRKLTRCQTSHPCPPQWSRPYLP